VTPNARKSEFAGWTADEKGRPVLLVKLSAPPVDGKANTELIRFLADALGCPKGQVTLAARHVEPSEERRTSMRRRWSGLPK
jgi:uncharacterized protein YggU (UPF0235/DUF167 family)